MYLEMLTEAKCSNLSLPSSVYSKHFDGCFVEIRHLNNICHWILRPCEFYPYETNMSHSQRPVQFFVSSFSFKLQFLEPLLCDWQSRMKEDVF